MKKHALIMAGGEGRRAGGELPKQFHLLLGIPMLWWSVRAFHREDPLTEISIVMHPGFFTDYDLMVATLPKADRDIPVRLVCGGRDRGESVKNGLMSIAAAKDIFVAVHDAARPMLTADLARRCWEEAAAHGAAVPCVPVTDSLRRVTPDGSRAVDRSEYTVVQTPQAFRADILKHAYGLPESPAFTDDASRVEADGVKVSLFPGIPENIKVTNPLDFIIAEALLKKTH